jgi:peptidoglycan/LPS O-acetylase OafA/YrhL
MFPTDASPTPPGRTVEASYRPEVDGLRAVAVLAVLLFHLGVPGFGGGFVGVDVFFVISGYLITRLILGELDGGRFRFSKFYARRARRLFPALFATLAAAFVAGCILLAPPHLEELAQSLVYALFSLSNVFFWSLTGYFDGAATTKPLLHTWSLGVEEQYYLVWPVALVVAHRLHRRFGVPALAAIVGIASFVAAELVVGTRPDAAFYLAPFRMGELALGALCLFTERRFPPRGIAREALTAVGLVLVGLSVVELGPAGRFPGLSALTPCLGTALVIFAGRGALAGALLSNRPAVWLGKISYSLYLVHWPLLVFAQYVAIEELTPERSALVGLASVVLAAASERFVERPFRARDGARRLSDPAFGLACAGLAGLLLLPAVTAIAERGWPKRVAGALREGMASLEAQKLRHFDDANATTEQPFPAAGRRNVAIVGDSHGADLLTALLRGRSEANFRFLHIVWNCQPVFGDRPYGDGTPIRTREEAEKCRAESEILRDNPVLEKADLILVAATWYDFGLDGLPTTIDYFANRYPGKIVIAGGRFTFTDPSALLARSSTADEANEAFDGAKRKAMMKQEMRALERIASEKGVALLDLRPFACDETPDGFRCPLLREDGAPLYWDTNHWTEAGARRVGRRLRDSGEWEILF